MLSGLRARELLFHIEGPVIQLGTATQGTWDIIWPAWPEVRGEPFVTVDGRPIFLNDGEHHPSPIFLRVHPPDAVKLESARTFDAQGWFEAGDDHDYATIACLDPSRAKSIEYRLDSPASTPPHRAFLHIQGVRDMLINKDLIVGEAIVDSLAVLAGLPLLVWLLVALHLRSRRRAETVVTTRPAAR